MSLYRYFGVYDVKSKASLPLKHLLIDAIVDEQFAKVKYSQVYVNSSENQLTTEFYFPIATTACFDGFKAKIGDAVIEGVIKPKEEAKEEFFNNMKKGNTVALAEIVEDMPDIMKIQIGNIPPNTEVDIEFSYIDRIEITMNRLLKFCIYSTLTKRYHSMRSISTEDS